MKWLTELAQGNIPPEEPAAGRVALSLTRRDIARHPSPNPEKSFSLAVNDFRRSPPEQEQPLREFLSIQIDRLLEARRQAAARES
jgi:hypothetical protein